MELKTRDGMAMNIGFEVTNAKRPILSVKKGAQLGAMTVFAPDNAGPGRSRIINDPIAIQEILAILNRTAGLQIDVENNSYVIDAEVVPKGSPAKGAWGTPPPMVAPVVSNQNLERVLG